MYHVRLTICDPSSKSAANKILSVFFFVYHVANGLQSLIMGIIDKPEHNWEFDPRYVSSSDSIEIRRMIPCPQIFRTENPAHKGWMRHKSANKGPPVFRERWRIIRSSVTNFRADVRESIIFRIDHHASFGEMSITLAPAVIAVFELQMVCSVIMWTAYLWKWEDRTWDWLEWTVNVNTTRYASCIKCTNFQGSWLRNVW